MFTKVGFFLLSAKQILKQSQREFVFMEWTRFLEIYVIERKKWIRLYEIEAVIQSFRSYLRKK